MYFICPSFAFYVLHSGCTLTSLIQSIFVVYNFSRGHILEVYKLAEAALGLLLVAAATSMLSEVPGLRGPR